MKGTVSFIPEARKIEFYDYDLPEVEPGAMLTEVTCLMTSSSRPILYIPKLSPMSQLRSI